MRCLLVGGVLTLAVAAHAGDAARPRAIAHRGVVQEAPENTWPAIAKAIELGCALAEIDLRYSADGEVVLVHDATLERTTNGSGLVRDKTLAQLQQLDAGAWKSAAFKGTRVPLLRDVVEQARGRIGLYLDLKEADPLPVVRLVEQLKAREMVFYRPYSYRALRQILAEAPGSRVLVDLGDWAQAPGLAEMLHRDIPTAALSGDWAIWTPGALAVAKRHGVLAFANVLGKSDTPDNLREAVRLGFDFIQTDNPRTLVGILREGDAKPKRAP
jgi:glycerophosphoryl diester phosphodiesterase